MKVNLVVACSLLSVWPCYVSCGDDSHPQSLVEENQSQVITFEPFVVTTGILGETKSETVPVTNYLKVIDLSGGRICQEINRSQQTDTDVLAPLSLDLSFGHHDLYFVCSSNRWHSYDTNDLLLTWDSSTAQLYDAWGVHLGLDVNASTSVNQSVCMERLVAYLQMVMTDAIPAGVSSFENKLTGGSWTLDLKTMSGAMAGVVGRTVALPADSIGATGVSVGLYTFVPQGTTTAAIYQFSALDKDGGVVATRVFTNVPISANHYTIFSGNVFGSESGFGLSVDGNWGAPNEIPF